MVDVQLSRNVECYNSEVKRVTDAYESAVQKTEFQTDPVQRQDLCCSVLRGQVCDSVVARRSWSFFMVQHIDQIVCVAVAMRDSTFRPSKLRESSVSQL